jgi:hypothetical protein
VTDNQPSDIRVSDSEREDALGKLGEHMSEGRLDLDEYGERTAKVTAAKTRGEVLALFGDLPEPRPAFGRPAPPPVPAAAPAPSFFHRAAPVAVPVVAIVLAFGLMVLVKLPFIFLLPFIFFAFSGSRRRGRDHYGRDSYRRAMREHRDAIRDHNRRMRGRWGDERY